MAMVNLNLKICHRALILSGWNMLALSLISRRWNYRETIKPNSGSNWRKKANSLSTVQVYGKISQEDEAGAIQKEKHSPNIVNVISAQAMERSPDINAANVLQRMSGLTIQRNGGADEAYPIIRGLDPRYNNTLINGIKITSPDDKSRYVPLNIVPSDLLGSIEVSKTLTPEMEADAIGGICKSGHEGCTESRKFKVLGSLGYSDIFFTGNSPDFPKPISSKKV